MTTESKHTPGPWEIEEIYPGQDFQCRIIARGVLNGGINGPQDAIIVGEPSKHGAIKMLEDTEWRSTTQLQDYKGVFQKAKEL